MSVGDPWPTVLGNPPQPSFVDAFQGERIAVLETKLDELNRSVEELRDLLKPMVALYNAGRMVIAVGLTIAGYTHWDQIVAYFNTKH